MTDTNIQDPPVTSQPGTPPAAPPAVPPTPPAGGEPPKAPKQPEQGDQNPAWLPDRLNQAKQAARNELLKQYGVEKPEDLTAKLQKLEELERSQLSEAERVQKDLEALKTSVATLKPYQDEFTKITETIFGKLPEETQQQIDAEANGDPLERARFMRVLGMIGGAAAPPGPKPAVTAPPGTPKPPPANGGVPTTAWEKYQAMNENQATRVQAAIFYQTNKLAIEASKPAG